MPASTPSLSRCRCPTTKTLVFKNARMGGRCCIGWTYKISSKHSAFPLVLLLLAPENGWKVAVIIIVIVGSITSPYWFLIQFIC